MKGTVVSTCMSFVASLAGSGICSLRSCSWRREGGGGGGGGGGVVCAWGGGRGLGAVITSHGGGVVQTPLPSPWICLDAYKF